MFNLGAASITIMLLILQVVSVGYATYSTEANDSLVITVFHDGFGPVRDGLRFILLDPTGGKILIESRDGQLLVPRVMEARLIGPLREGSEVYLPVDIPVPRLASLESEALIVIEEASVVKFTDLYPWIDGSPINVQYRLELGVVNGNYSSTIFWGHASDQIKRLIGLADGEVPVPRSLDHRLYVEFKVVGSGIEWVEEVAGEVRDVQSASLLRWIYPQALMAVEEFASNVNFRLSELASLGIYLGYQSGRLDKAYQLIQTSREEFESRRLREAYSLLRRSYTELQGIESVLDGYSAQGARGGVLIPLFLILGALASSHLVMGEKRKSVMSGMLILSIITFTFVAMSYPPLLPNDAWGWSTLMYSALVMLGLVWGVQLLGLEVRTYRGVALVSAIYLAFSVSVRFLKTRPLRTWLMIAMSTITVASVLLLVNTGVEGQVFVSNPIEKVSPHGEAYVIVYSRDYRFDNLAAVETDFVPFISSLGVRVGVRSETPIFPPSGREYIVNHNSYNLRGVIGIQGDAPFKRLLEECVVAGSIRNVGVEPGASVVSQDLAENLGLTVGSPINVNGIMLRVDGILSTECSTYIKDVDGYFVSTLTEPPMSPVTPAGWSNIVVTGLEESLSLGAIPTKIYAHGEDEDEARKLAELVALHTNLKIRMVTAEGDIFVFNFVRLAGISGGEVMVVAGIAFLNLLVASLANYYERRGEFLTMSTLGLNPGHIILLASAEALILAVISSYIGILMTLGVLGTAPRLAEIPIDFKLTQANVFGVLLFSALIFIASHVLSVRKSVILSTPSQTWKWTLSKALDEEGYWRVELPARLRASRIRHFITYLSSRLSEYSYTTTVNISVLGVEEQEEGVHRLRFIYASTEQRSFRASCILEVVGRGEWCSSNLRVKVEAQDMRFIDQYLREITQLMRLLIIEYTSLTVRILVPLGRDSSYIPPLITVYNPSEVRIVWRGTSEEDLQRAVQILEDYRVRSVIVRLSPPSSVAADGKSVLEAAKECDLISISSDDGYLSSLALLAAQRLNKRVCIVGDSAVSEVSSKSLWEQIR